MSCQERTLMSTACLQETSQIVGVVYLVTNQVNGKKYVGQTKSTLSHRWTQHKNLAKGGRTSAIYHAIRKYGPEAFTIELLERVKGSHEDLLKAEKAHIARQSCIAPGGYNLSEGGEGVDFSVPRIRENHAKAVQLVASSDSWKQAQYEGARKRLVDPGWRENNSAAIARMQGSPDFWANHSKVMQEVYADPKWKKSLAEGISRRSSNLEWRQNQTTAMKRLHADPSHQKKRDSIFRTFNEIKAAEAKARDALLPPKEAARRVKRRASNLARYYAKKAQAGL